MIDKIQESINVLDTNINYWFVRTDSGNYFDTFWNNNFIGLGWNSITVHDLQLPKSQTIQKIYRTEKLDSKITADKKKASDIYNKLIRFRDLKQNDVIVIPSEKSNFLAFGIVSDNKIFTAESGAKDCNYIKRRKIEWIVDEPKKFTDLDEIFYAIRTPRHSISNISHYAEYIDSVMYSVYKKADTSHFVVNIKKQGEINWLQLVEILKNMHDFMSQINKTFDLEENVNESAIQISLQSPGLFNLKHKGYSLILLAALLGSSSCSNVETALPDEQKKIYQQIKKSEKDTISNLKDTLKDLQVKL